VVFVSYFILHLISQSIAEEKLQPPHKLVTHCSECLDVFSLPCGWIRTPPVHTPDVSKPDGADLLSAQSHDHVYRIGWDLADPFAAVAPYVDPKLVEHPDSQGMNV